MSFERKSSQGREMQFTTDFPPLPADAPPAMETWYRNFKDRLKADHQTIEDAFAKLRTQIEAQSDAARLALIESRLATLEGSGFTMPLIFDYHVSEQAAIKESKLALTFPTHSNANDPTTDQKAALQGTQGNPSDINRYVTNEDSRLLGTHSRLLEMEFSAAAQTWTWVHNLGYRPHVEVYNTDREKMVAYAVHVDEDEITIEHTYNATGWIVITDLN